MQNPQTIRNTAGLAERLAPDTEAVADILRQQVASHVPLVSEIAGHLLDAEGKRLRPLLTCAAAHLCGTPPDELPKAHKLAAAVELMHSATLLHDDVVDLGALRRGQPAANVVWGNKASVLTGDFLLGRAFGLIVEVGCPSALQVLARAAITVSEGEMLGLRTTRRTDLTRAEIIAVMEGKTAALFSAACEAGACLVEPENLAEPPVGSKRAAMAEFGQAIGLAFQMVDDLLDYEGGSAVTGKAAGDDLRDGRMTLPVWLAWQAGDDSERAFWHRVLVEESNQGNSPVLADSVAIGRASGGERSDEGEQSGEGQKAAHKATHKATHEAHQKATHKAPHKAIQKATHKAFQKAAVGEQSGEDAPQHPESNESPSRSNTASMKDNLKLAQALLVRHGVGDMVRGEASGLLAEADMILKGFPASGLREALEKLVREGSRRIS